MDYIPQPDNLFADWSANFESGIDTEFAAYGLSNGQATAYTALDTAYQAALLLAQNPGTRTPVTIAAKDSAKAAAMANARVLAQIATNYPGTNNAGRALLGLTLRPPGGTPIPAPATKPVLIVVGYNPLEHVLQIRDETTPTSRAKPPGTISAQVWVKIGPTPPASIDDCRMMGVYTKPFLNVSYDGADAGQIAYYITRWQTRKGLVGPTSDLRGATITAA